MRTPARNPTIAPVPTEPSEIHLILLINLDADPTRGSLETPGRSAR
jgi:hypothetical protein